MMRIIITEFYFFLKARAGRILGILQSDLFREWAGFSYSVSCPRSTYQRTLPPGICCPSENVFISGLRWRNLEIYIWLSGHVTCQQFSVNKICPHWWSCKPQWIEHWLEFQNSSSCDLLVRYNSLWLTWRRNCDRFCEAMRGLQFACKVWAKGSQRTKIFQPCHSEVFRREDMTQTN